MPAGAVMPSTPDSRVAVIGAGIVGTAAALALSLRGHAVLLLDPVPPGSGASGGNAGGLSAGSVLPLAGPGMLRQIPRWLIDPLGPLAIRASHLWALLPWLRIFVASGTAERRTVVARALAALNGPVLSAYRELVEAGHAGDLIRENGHLTVYRSERQWQADRADWALRRELGVACEEIGAGGLRDLEPALDPGYRFGMFLPGNGHCTEPKRLVERFAAAVVARGGDVVTGRAVSFERVGSRVVAVLSDRGRLPVHAVVLAAGAWSGPLAASLGSPVPLESERGYHATIAAPDLDLTRPVLDAEAKCAVTSMDCGLRAAGTVELAGLSAPPDWRRARHLVAVLQRMLPALSRSLPEERVSLWMGHRPGLPDSLPVIGPSRLAGNAILAFGHGHTGMTGAAMTARLVCDLVAGDPPCIDLQPFRAERFQRRPGQADQGRQT